MFHEFIDIFEHPTEFFKKHRKYSIGVVLFLTAVIVNSIMSELLLQYHFVDFGRILDPYFAISAKILLSIAGYAVLTTICAGVLKLLGGKNIRTFYTVTAYSLMVLIFLWVPHILVAGIVFAWFIMLMIFGMKQYNEVDYKKGILIVILFMVLVIVFAFVVHDYVPIFPWKVA